MKTAALVLVVAALVVVSAPSSWAQERGVPETPAFPAEVTELFAQDAYELQSGMVDVGSYPFPTMKFWRVIPSEDGGTIYSFNVLAAITEGGPLFWGLAPDGSVVLSPVPIPAPATVVKAEWMVVGKGATEPLRWKTWENTTLLRIITEMMRQEQEEGTEVIVPKNLGFDV